MRKLDEFHEILASPAFGFEEERGLKPLAWDLDATHKHLLYLLSQQPTALLQHVQRINLAVVSGDSAKVHSALLDMFLVLGNKGKAIRAEMLSLAMPLLEEEQASFYLERMNSGAMLNTNHPEAFYSVCSLGLEGSLDLIAAGESSRPLCWCELDWAGITKLLG